MRIHRLNRDRMDSGSQLSEKSCGLEPADPRTNLQSLDISGHLEKSLKIPLPTGESNRQMEYARRKRAPPPRWEPEQIGAILERMRKRGDLPVAGEE